MIHFGPYCLDTDRHQLTHGDDEVRLRPKSWKVLSYLAHRPGMLVSSDELLDAVWPGTTVTPQTLSNVVWELRKKLGGPLQEPLIETVPRRGFRFVAAVVDRPTARPSQVLSEAMHESPSAGHHPTNERFVGRKRELATLTAAWKRALAGQRQLLLLAGDAGVGKTALIEHFQATLDTQSDAQGDPEELSLLWGRGNCLPQAGGSGVESFQPFLEVLEGWAGGEHRDAWVESMRRFAPTWLLQLPWLVTEEELGSAQLAVVGSGSARMLRDGAKLLEAMSARVPIVLVIEDLQWTDPATVDLLVNLAGRTGSARILIIATLRPSDLALAGDSTAEAVEALRARPFSTSLELPPLSATEVLDYVAARFGSESITRQLATPLFEYAGGNPLFLQSTLEELVESGVLAPAGEQWRLTDKGRSRKLKDLARTLGIPETLNGLVEARIGHIPSDHKRVLAAAANAGSRFSIQEVAAALDRSEIEVDKVCDAFRGRAGIIRFAGNTRWPDGSMVVEYEFTYELARQVLARGVSALERREIHGRIGQRLEAGHLTQTMNVAARLAWHWYHAGDHDRSATFSQIAGQRAASKLAYGEVADHFARAAESLSQLPDTPERGRRRSELLLGKASVVSMTSVFGGDAALADFEKARELALAADHPQLVFRAQMGRCFALRFALRLDEARYVGSDLLDIANTRLPTFLPAAHLYNAYVDTALGDFRGALERTELAATLEAEPGIPPFYDLQMALALHAATCLTLLGDLPAAAQKRDAALSRADELSMPYQRLIVLVYGAAQTAWTRNWSLTKKLAAEALNIADELNIQNYATMSRIFLEKARVASNLEIGTEALEAAIREHLTAPEKWWSSLYFAWLAEAQIERSDVDTAAGNLDRASAIDEHEFRSEIARLRGELLVPAHMKVAPQAQSQAAKSKTDGPSNIAAAENHFREAIRLAGDQQARLFQVRATTSLARLLAASKRRLEAADELRAAPLSEPLSDGSQDDAEAFALLATLQS